MTCIKTGAVIFIEPYQEFAYCDAFEINNIAYFRIVERIRLGQSKDILLDINYVIYDYQNWFDKDSKTTSTLITNNYIYVGYNAKPYDEVYNNATE